MLLLFVLNEAGRFLQVNSEHHPQKNLDPAAMVCSFHGLMLLLSDELQYRRGRGVDLIFPNLNGRLILCVWSDDMFPGMFGPNDWLGYIRKEMPENGGLHMQ